MYSVTDLSIFKYITGVLKNLATFTGKQLCWSLSFNKVAGLFDTSAFL